MAVIRLCACRRGHVMDDPLGDPRCLDCRFESDDGYLWRKRFTLAHPVINESAPFPGAYVGV